MSLKKLGLDAPGIFFPAARLERQRTVVMPLPSIPLDKQSYYIRGQRIWPNTALSPMSGVTDAPFRRLCQSLAGGRVGMLVSEFVSTDAAHHLGPKNHKAMRFYADERPFCMQIFGAVPQRMVHGAVRSQELGADFLEVNAGCPVPKVTGKGGGAGLLRDLPLLARILRDIKKEIRIPLLLKCRVGWDEHSVNIRETLRIAEGEGVELLTIHGRNRVQGYKGLADWDLIGATAAQAVIPVAGNGDVQSVTVALERLRRYPVAGLGIGRAALHNPWLFGQIADAYEGKPVREVLPDDVYALVLRYWQLMLDEDCTPMRALGRLKQMAARLCKGFEPDVPEFRIALLRAPTLEAFLEKLQGFFSALPAGEEVRFRPERLLNLNGGTSNEIEYGRQFR